MLAWYGAGATQAWVRAPAEAGLAGAWREVARADVVEYVLSTRGRVDVVTSSPLDGGRRFSLVADAPGESVTVVAKDLPVDGDLWCVGRKGSIVVGLRRTEKGLFARFSIEAGQLRQDGILLEGGDHANPESGCGF